MASNRSTFVSIEHRSPLPYEIEKWDETGTSFVWVKVPQIPASSSADFIYLYYDHGAESHAQNAPAHVDLRRHGKRRRCDHQRLVDRQAGRDPHFRRGTTPTMAGRPTPVDDGHVQYIRSARDVRQRHLGHGLPRLQREQPARCWRARDRDGMGQAAPTCIARMPNTGSRGGSCSENGAQKRAAQKNPP